jgi:hypothetical protein
MLLVCRRDTFERNFAWNTSEIESGLFRNSKIVSVSNFKGLDIENFDNHGSLFMHNKSWEHDICDILISHLKVGSIEGIDGFGDDIFAEVFIIPFFDSFSEDLGLLIGRHLLVIYEQLVGIFPIDGSCSSVCALFIGLR